MTAAHVANELIQAKLLAAIFSHSLRGELALKGGMAMRVIGNSPRYTKDIDLAGGPSVASEAIRGRIRKAIADLRATGMIKDLVVTEPKQTATTLRWKINGTVTDTHVRLTIEVSKRDPLDPKHIKAIAWTPPAEYELPPIFVDTFDGQAIAAMKVGCLLDPKREAPRDLFDLYVLVKAHVAPPSDLIRKVQKKEHLPLQDAISIIKAKMEKMTYEAACEELRPYLPDTLRSRFDERLWDEIRLKAGASVEQWLKKASDATNDNTPEPQ